MQKITPFLWFNGNVEEAVNFYTSIFKDSNIVCMRRMGGPKVFTATFQLAGKDFMALDGGPMYQFTPCTSFFVTCEKEQEIDELWEGLGEGGMTFMPLSKYPFSEKFGWVQDKFGLSWQLNLTGAKQNITPFLTFVNEQAGKAEEAISFYTSLFPPAEVLRIVRFGAGENGTEGTVKHAAFTLHGNEFMAMDSSIPHAFNFSHGVSFFVTCDTQEEIDSLWNKLSDEGKQEMCGWLQDKYGVSWQIIPANLEELLYESGSGKAKQVMDALLKMQKLDKIILEQA